jgi:hypothetical protein
LNVEWQGRIAVGFVALAAMLVAGHYLKKPLGGRLARGLLKRGHVKWAMRMRKFSGDRDCC